MNPGALLALLLLPGGALAEGWREIERRDGVVVEVRRAEGAALVRGTAELPVAVERVRRVLLDVSSFDAWMPGLLRWEVLERAPGALRVYGRHDLPWPLADRDYVVRYAWSEEPGGFALEARSVAGGPDPEPRVVRLERVYSRWELRPGDRGGSWVRYTYDGELGGRLPSFWVERAWRSQAPELLARLEARAASSVLLEDDRVLRTVLLPQPRLGLQAGRHGLVQQHAVTALVVAEEVRRQRVAAPVSDAELLLEPELHATPGQTSGR